MYNLQPDLLGSFTADVCPVITDQFGCGHREKFGPSMGRGGGQVRKKGVAQGPNSPFSGGGGFGGGEKVSSMAARAYHPDSSYSRHQIPSNTLICLFSRRRFPSKDILFPPHIPASRNLPNRSIGCPLERAVMWLISGYCAIWTVHVLEKVLL